MPSKSERTVYKELYTRASTAEQVLAELGYKVYIGAPHPDQYGVFRQKSDASKGIEWKGQENYDFGAEALMKYIQERMVTETATERSAYLRTRTHRSIRGMGPNQTYI